MEQSFRNCTQLNPTRGLDLCAHHTRATIQRYKVLADADVQVCCVPRGKNIVDKIRFSRCFRRWQADHITLEESEIISVTVGLFLDN